jgi:hypothetical protein
MSPFEKKIATYQKSAERRKQGDRSGSRSRGANNTNLSNNVSQDPYSGGTAGAMNQSDIQESHELRVLRSRIKQLDNTFEDFTGKLLVRGQDSKDMDRQVDSVFTEINKFSHALEATLNAC